MSVPMPAAPKENAVPAVDMVVPRGDGFALRGLKCKDCGAVYSDRRTSCSRCHGRDCLEPFDLGETGKLYVFSIVHRSYPGIEVPYVSAVVDLDSGCSLKGNLCGVEPEPSALSFGMPVRVVFGDAQGQTDAEGKPYATYYFVPA